MHRILACLSAFALLPLAAVAADVVTLTNGEWPPYLSERAAGNGIASRIVRDAFAQEGIEVRYVFRPWRRAYLEAASGQYDGTLVWTYGEARAQRFYFSDTVFEGKSVFFHLKSYAFNWVSFDDLASQRIGGALGYEYEFENRPGIVVQRADTEIENFRKLLAGRIDIFPSEINAGYAILQKHFTAAEQARITYHAKAYNVVSYHLLLNRKSQRNVRLLAAFNRGLSTLKSKGLYGGYFAAAR
ncbi:substrate-binding periplasmic protein [Chitinimonas naiadis]